MAHYYAERADALHRLTVVRSSGPGRLRAGCHCGFTSPEFSSAGLAESCVDAHIACERSRAIHIDSAVLRLQSMALQAQKSRSRQWLETTISQIRERARSLVPVDPQMWSAVDLVVVDDDKRSLTDTAGYLASVGNFRIVGEGTSGVDAVALTVVEEPGILLVDDDMAPMDGPSAITLLRRLEVTTRLCLYGDTAPDGCWADLVLTKDVPLPRLSEELAALSR